MKLLYCALIRVCAVIRSHMVSPGISHCSTFPGHHTMYAQHIANASSSEKLCGEAKVWSCSRRISFQASFLRTSKFSECIKDPAIKSIRNIPAIWKPPWCWKQKLFTQYCIYLKHSDTWFPSHTYRKFDQVWLPDVSKIMWWKGHRPWPNSSLTLFV